MQVTNNGRVAHVDTRWFFGAVWYTSSFTVLHQQKRWLVDDVYCAGHRDNSIYRPSSSGCKPTIPPSFHPRGTATAMQAVSAVVRPFYRGVTGTCSPETGMVFTCPITLRLPRYLAEPSASTVTFCRCQNPPTGTRSRQIDNTGRVAHVSVDWYYGGRIALFSTTFVVLHGRMGWLVDDQDCAGRPGTSIYNPRAGPCR
jgi:hypothetical protein